MSSWAACCLELPATPDQEVREWVYRDSLRLEHANNVVDYQKIHKLVTSHLDLQREKVIEAGKSLVESK